MPHGFSNFCIDGHVIKFGRLQEELVEWRNKCFETKSFVHHRTQMPPISKHCMMN